MASWFWVLFTDATAPHLQSVSVKTKCVLFTFFRLLRISRVQEVLGYYEILRAEFPNARLSASSLDNFFDVVQSVRDRLPVVTSEFGDTWIQGVASDPHKCAEYRAVSRVMRDCLAAGVCTLRNVTTLPLFFKLIILPAYLWNWYTIRTTVQLQLVQWWREMVRCLPTKVCQESRDQSICRLQYHSLYCSVLVAN